MEQQERFFTEEQKRKYTDAVIRLCAHVVRGELPDAEWVRGLDLELLYKFANRHMLTGIVAYALESVRIKDVCFTQAKGKAIRKVATMDMEMGRIFAEFDRAGIWHVPLKGSVIKDFYPEVGMRQMSDHDILIDVDKAGEARRIMEALSFETVVFDVYVHDTYHKEPVCNFELHRKLFSASFDKRIAEYYENVRDRLIRDEEGGFGYHFSPEDFYVYVTAHEYKHYSGNGTGLRSLLDTYVFLRHYEKDLDWDYMAGELKKLGLEGFEGTARGLSVKLFEGKELSEKEQEMLEEIMGSGVYGSLEKGIEKGIREKGRLTFLMELAFPKLEYMKQSVRFVKNYPFLYPFGILYRWGRGLLRQRKYLRRVCMTVWKSLA